VTIEGGLVQDVTTEGEVAEVVIVDYDADEPDAPNAQEIDGDLAYVTIWDRNLSAPARDRRSPSNPDVSAAIERQRAADFTPVYSPWRHGGWYVDNVVYPSGAVGCVSRNYPDHKWRVVCTDAYPGEPGDVTYPNRDAAARAEYAIARAEREQKARTA
jgi:hypothetical protein